VAGSWHGYITNWRNNPLARYNQTHVKYLG